MGGRSGWGRRGGGWRRTGRGSGPVAKRGQGRVPPAGAEPARRRRLRGRGLRASPVFRGFAASRCDGGVLESCVSPPVVMFGSRCSDETLSALRLVLRVLRLDHLPRVLPVALAPLAQLVEVAAVGQRAGAVH